jgi:3-oxoacyl-[acyl-carrier-protein] synthase II
MLRRVVVTGVGLVSPLGSSSQTIFESLCNSEIGISEISHQEYPEIEDFPIKIAGLLPKSFDKAKAFKEVGFLKNLYNALALSTSKAAFEDSKFVITDEETSRSAGIMYGSDKSSSLEYKTNFINVTAGGFEKLDRFFIPKILISQCAGTIGIPLKLKGYTNSITAGWATGQVAVADAYRAIKLGHSDAMIAGSSEPEFDPSILISLYKSGILARSNELDSCKPFDIARDGIIYSIGGGAIFLEELESALKRNANIYAEVVATSSCSDTRPQNNTGVERAMKLVIDKAQISPDRVSLVYADAAGYQKWDEWEASAIEKLFKHALVTSNKANLGHMLSASGMSQVIMTLLALKHQTVPPIPNLIVPVNENLNYVVKKPVKSELEYAVSNNFSYDGAFLSSILFKKF